MALEFSEASEEDDVPLQEFMGELGVDVPSEWWGRAFSPAAPAGLTSRPYIIRDLNDGRIVAYGASRPAELTIGADSIDSQILHDLMCAGTDDGARGMGILLGEVMRRATVSFSGGPSLRTSLALAAAHWQHAGWFLRARVEAGDKPGADAPSGLQRDLADQSEPPPDGPVARFARSAESRHWLASAPEIPHAEHWKVPGAFEATTRRTPSSAPKIEENLIVDLQLGEQDPVGSLHRLAEAARSSGRATYLSVFAPQFVTAIRQAGWKLLKPRWALYWTVGGPGARELAGELASCPQWWVTPMDVELDRVPIQPGG